MQLQVADEKNDFASIILELLEKMLKDKNAVLSDRWALTFLLVMILRSKYHLPIIFHNSRGQPAARELSRNWVEQMTSYLEFEYEPAIVRNLASFFLCVCSFFLFRPART